MDLLWAVLCRFSSIDKDRNSISLIEIVEVINFTSPAEMDFVPIEAELVMLWQRSVLDRGEQSQNRVILITPRDEILLPNPFLVDLQEYERSRHRMYIRGLPFQGNGVYKFVVQADEGGAWKDLAILPVSVTKTTISEELP